MADDFTMGDIDVNALQAAHSSIREIESSTSRTSSNMSQINSALNTLGRMQQEMSKASIIDPNALNEVRELQSALEGIGVTKQAIARAAKDELGVYEKLSKIDKLRVKMMTQKEKSASKVVMYKGQEIRLEAKSVKLKKASVRAMGKVVGKLKGAARGATSFATNMAGVQVSIVGIIALLLDLYNKTNKIGAMSKQMAFQWENSNTAIKTSSKTMSMLRNQFQMTVEEAGAFATSLARSGVEEEDILKVSKEILAVEHATGVAAAQTTAQMIKVADSYNMTNDEALGVLHSIKESTKNIPGLSMEDVTNDMMQMVELSRTYNTDLNSTLALYNALTRKDVSETLGLGDLPRELGRQLAVTIAGMRQKLSSGWKAAIMQGSQGGADYASNVLSFEKLSDIETFQKLIEFVSKQAQGFGGAKKEFVVRQLLEGKIESKPILDKVAEAIASGELSSDKLAELNKAYTDEAGKADKAANEEKNSRKEMIVLGRRIATASVDFETRLKNMITNNLLSSEEWKGLYTQIDEMAKWLLANAPDFFRELLGSINYVVGILKEWFRHDTGEELASTEQHAQVSNVLKIAAAMEKTLTAAGQTPQAQAMGAGGFQKRSAAMFKPAFDQLMRQQGGAGTEVARLSGVLPEAQKEGPGLLRQAILAGLSETDKGSFYPELSELQEFVKIIASKNTEQLKLIMRRELLAINASQRQKLGLSKAAVLQEPTNGMMGVIAKGTAKMEYEAGRRK